jgi:hypothetical protein
MDIMQIIGLMAPALVTLLVQGLKKLSGSNGYVAMGLVFVVGGITALVGIGPNPGSGWIDTSVNAGWIIGLASFIYNIFKPQSSV